MEAEPQSEESDRSGLTKYLAIAMALAVAVLLLLNKPPKEITIDPPVLQTEATAEAYFANLDRIAAYAAILDERKKRHPELHRIRFTDYQEMKAGAQQLAAANPALANDEILWSESQKMADAMLLQLKNLDYALTASGL